MPLTVDSGMPGPLSATVMLVASAATVSSGADAILFAGVERVVDQFFDDHGRPFVSRMARLRDQFTLREKLDFSRRAERDALQGRRPILNDVGFFSDLLLSRRHLMRSLHVLLSYCPSRCVLSATLWRVFFLPF